MTTVWRIGHCPTPAPEAPVLLAALGHGSTLGNGRWHTMGAHQVVHCSSSRALCQLEKRFHANGSNPTNQALMRLQLPADCPLDDVMALGLPAHWKDDTGITQTIGNAWLQNGSALGMWVPSYIEPGEKNLLLNPAHPAYVRIGLALERHPFVFDPRHF